MKTPEEIATGIVEKLHVFTTTSPRYGEMTGAILDNGALGLMHTIAAAIREARIAALEGAAKICDDADKSTHPADLAQAIRERIEEES